MSNEPKPPATKPSKPAGEPEDTGTRAAISTTGTTGTSGASSGRAKPSETKLPPFDERRIRYSELVPHVGSLDADELLEMLRDGRATVRANAALGLAALGVAAPSLRCCETATAGSRRPWPKRSLGSG